MTGCAVDEWIPIDAHTPPRRRRPTVSKNAATLVMLFIRASCSGSTACCRSCLRNEGRPAFASLAISRSAQREAMPRRESYCVHQQVSGIGGLAYLRAAALQPYQRTKSAVALLE